MVRDMSGHWRRERRDGREVRVTMPEWSTALRRGAAGRCPACGEGRLFRGYLSVATRCARCDAPLGDVPADDAPTYLTLLIACHLLIGLVVVLERDTSLGTGAIVASVLPIAVAVCLGLLRPVKGGLVAVLLKLDVWRGGDGTGSADHHAR